METQEAPTSSYLPQDGAPRDEPGAASLPDRSPRRSRWRVWVSLGLALVVLRLAFPIVLAPMLASRLSRVLGTRVDVGDVSFAPIDAVVTLRDVTVQAPEAMGATPGGAPAVVADRVRLDVQWLPLLHRTVLVRELVLESARIELDRLTGEGVSLETFLRADPASELPPNWTFALDRIVLRDAALHLRGVANGDLAALEVKLRDAQVSTLPRRATAFGRAPNLRVDATVEGGRIRVDGSSDLRDDGVLLDSRIRAKDVPLAPLRAYLPDLGWSGVGGRLSARLHYKRDPARRDLLTGRLIARRVAVRVPALVEPALAIRRAVVDVEGIDRLARRVAIGSLTLHGATLAARPDLAVPIPLLDGARVSSAAVPTPRHRALPDEPGRKATPWRWTIARFAAPSGRVRFAGHDGAVGVVASLSAENLGPGAYWSPLRAWFRHGDGAAAFDGTARMTHGLVIDGRFTAGAIDVPAFARAVGIPWADLARAGRGAADLSLELAPGATDGSAVDAHGRVSLVDLSVAGPDATAFALRAGTMELELAGILARGGDAHGPGSIELRISDVTVGAPQVQLTRTPEGWVLPPFADDANPPAAATVAAADLPQESSPNVRLAVAQLRTNGGRVTIEDTAANPPVTIDLALSEGWGRDVRLPGVTLGDFALAGSDRRLGALRLGGTRGVDGRALELSGESVPLAAAAPFLVRAGLPYRLEGGTASFLSRVAVARGRWTADTTLSLREPTVAGDTAALREALGTSVETAFAALRDSNGDVTLHLALAAPGPGDTRTFPDAVARAVRDAVARGDQGLLPDAPLRITFAPGRAELTAHGARQIATIAEILDARPNLVVELTAPVSTDDRRSLAARALADDLEPAGGFKSVLRTFGVRDRRERIRQALEDRADGRPGRLDADDEAALQDMLAHRAPVDAGRLAALAAARVRRVKTELADHHDIAPARVVVADAGPDDSVAPPAVRGRIGVDPRVAPLSAPSSEATTAGVR